MPTDLNGSAVLVTGAASGIGAACARGFAGEGARVGLVDRDAAALAEVESELQSLGATVVSATADVRTERAVRDAVGKVAEHLGGIDILAGCAGVSGPFGARVEDITGDDFADVLDVNVTGQFLVVKHTLGHLKQSAAAAVVLVASDSAFVAAPGMVPYCASKAAVVQLVRALSVDLADDGVRVNCVCPSVVDTPLARADLGERVTEGDFPVQSPDEVARQVIHLACPASRPVNGQALVCDFGYSARSSFPA